MPRNCEISVSHPDFGEKRFSVFSGATLREVLLENACSPYRGKFRLSNCRGLGICGSCKIEVLENGQWWERRACQIRIYQDTKVRML